MTQESLTVNICWCVNCGGTVVLIFAFLPSNCQQPKQQIPLDEITDCSEGLPVKVPYVH